MTAGFESLKQTNEHDAEYWRARDLQPLLGYSQWRRFEQAIDRAKASCEASGNVTENHFAGAGKMVDLGSGSQRPIDDYDYHLSRFACYLSLDLVDSVKRTASVAATLEEKLHCQGAKKMNHNIHSVFRSVCRHRQTDQRARYAVPQPGDRREN